MQDRTLATNWADQARLNESRLESLAKLSRMTGASEQEVTDFALEQGVLLTQSRIGYFAVVNEDETVLTMYSWSKEAERECAVAGRPKVYSTASTGLWAEALRKRRPVITNDYAAENPAKRGFPEGHLPLSRHLGVPIFDGKRIVAIVGVANKPLDYDESDARQLTLLMEAMWLLLQRNGVETELRRHRDELERLVEERTAELTVANQEVRDINAELQRQLAEKSSAQEALTESEERLRTICDSALDAVIMIDATGRVVFWNPAAEAMFGYGSQEIVGRMVHQILTPLQLRERAGAAFERFAKSGRGRVVGRIMRLEAVRKDGTTFPVELSVSGFQRGEQWWAAAIVRDVTQRKQAEKALEEYAIELEQRSTELTGINGQLAREMEARHKAFRAVKLEQQRLRRLLDLHDSQRHLIAYEIHDGLAQQLAGAKMQWESFGRLFGARDERAEQAYQSGLKLLQQCIGETRRLISGLRPPVLDDCGVIPALRDFLGRIDSSHATIEMESDLDDDQRFGPLLENAIFRIVQESVNNALHHGKSERVRIHLQRTDRGLRIEVQDWGIGFTPKNVRQGAYGLEGIRQRARLLGGQATVASEPGQGTLIAVELPLTNENRPKPVVTQPGT